MNDLLIKNAVLNGKVTDLLVDNGKISSISAGIEAAASEVIECGGRYALTLPFFNAHSHAAMTLFRGYAEDKELFDWLNNYIWPAEAKLTFEDVYIGTRLAILEMIKSGTVWFNDSYWFPDAVLKAVQECGLRASLGIFYLGEMERNRSMNEKLVEAYAECDRNRIVLTHFPHAIYTVDEKSLRLIKAAMESDGRQVHIHVAETAKEVADCLREHGRTPVAYLNDLGLIGPRSILAHCVHLTDEDRRIIAEQGAYIAHCPVSNAKLCSGGFDFEAALAAGCRIAIGTDGSSSNNSLSMLEEMKMAGLNAKIVSGLPTAGCCEELWRSAVLVGAQFAGVNAGLAVGCDADFLLVDLKSAALCTGHDLVSDLIYAAGPEVVDTVVCAGRILMKHRIVPGEDEVISAAMEVCRKIRKF